MADRPLTQRELQKINEKKSRYVAVWNICKQAVSIQLRPPLKKDGSARVDFYSGQQTISLSPGQGDQFPEDRLIPEQIANLQKKGMIRIGPST